MLFRALLAVTFTIGLFADPPSGDTGIRRWLSADDATIASRFVWVQGTQGETNASQLQHQEALQARLSLLPGKLSVVGAAAPGAFTAGWNNSGLGLNSWSGQLYVKQLYLSARPAKFVELQYGGFGIERGVSTAVTSYHDQGFMTGQRAILSTPERLWFDRISFTYGYLGDYDRPGINKRFNRLDEGNYRQFQVMKNLNNRTAFSADFTNHRGIRTLREAVSVRVPSIVDSVRFEVYQRLDNRAAGFHAGVSRKLNRRLSVDAGYMAIDRNFGDLNDDAFMHGNRVYAGPSVHIARGLSFFSLFHRTVGTSYDVANRTFMHVGLQYNLLEAWRESAGR